MQRIKLYFYLAISTMLLILALIGGCGGTPSTGGISISQPNSNTQQDTSTNGVVFLNSQLDNNVSTQVSAKFLDSAGAPATRLQVVFWTTRGSFTPNDGVAMTDNYGVATITLNAGGTAGNGIVTATANINGKEITKGGTFTVGSQQGVPQVRVAKVELSASTMDLGQNITVTVSVVDPDGKPYSQNTPVEVVFFTASGNKITSPVKSGANGQASTTYNATYYSGEDYISAYVGSTKPVTATVVVNTITIAKPTIAGTIFRRYSSADKSPTSSDLTVNFASPLLWGSRVTIGSTSGSCLTANPKPTIYNVPTAGQSAFKVNVANSCVYKPPVGSSYANDFINVLINTPDGKTITFDLVPEVSSSVSSVPGPPDKPTVNAVNATTFDVTFKANTYSGTSAITGYTVVASPNTPGITTAQTVTLNSNTPPFITHRVSGLAPGTSYAFTVYATNASGNSALSAASDPQTPPIAPGVPTTVTAAPSVAGSVDVSFVAPLNRGNSPITGYTVSSSPAGGVDSNAATTATTHTVTGLTTGTSYTFTVTATNIAGTSSASASSLAILAP